MADDVERLVVEALGLASSRDHLAADAASGTWNTETRNVIRESVERVLVYDEEIRVVLKGSVGVSDVSATEEGDHDRVQTILKAPLPDARPRARKEILVPGDRGSGL